MLKSLLLISLSCLSLEGARTITGTFGADEDEDGLPDNVRPVNLERETTFNPGNGGDSFNDLFPGAPPTAAGSLGFGNTEESFIFEVDIPPILRESPDEVIVSLTLVLESVIERISNPSIIVSQDIPAGTLNPSTPVVTLANFIQDGSISDRDFITTFEQGDPTRERFEGVIFPELDGSLSTQQIEIDVPLENMQSVSESITDAAALRELEADLLNGETYQFQVAHNFSTEFDFIDLNQDVPGVSVLPVDPTQPERWLGRLTGSYIIELEEITIPEPSTAILLFGGLLSFCTRRNR